MEKFIYESKPFFAFGAAAYALYAGQNTNLLFGCGVILMISSVLMYKQRLDNRGFSIRNFFKH